MDFDSYEDLLRSMHIAESLESIPPVMFEVLGTVLEDVPERTTARVYRTPRTVGNPAGTLRAVDTLNGTRTVFQSALPSLVTKFLAIDQKPCWTWKRKRQAHPPVR